MQIGIYKTPKCFSCPGNCKELSKMTRRSTHDLNQAMVMAAMDKDAGAWLQALPISSMALAYPGGVLRVLEHPPQVPVH